MSMTVGQLKAALENVPDDTLVILSKDAEGNGFSPLYEAETDVCYHADTTWSGEIVDEPHGARAVCLWPVN